MKRNNSEHPYTVLQKMKCPWLDSLTAEVNRSIVEYDKFIKAEADADKCIDFAKESFLYERFKDNLYYGMVYCNIEVLKYFCVYFEQKILYSMVGEDKFTKHDQEIYEYFRNTDFTACKKYTNRILRYINDTPVFIGDVQDSVKWSMIIGNDTVNYIDMFIEPFVACNDMVRNAKSLDLYRPDIDFFKQRNVFNIFGHEALSFNTKTVVKFK